MAYASGQKALGICDCCGFTYKLRQLKPVVVNRVMNGLKFCPSCWSPDQPQLQVGQYNRTPEAIALYQPKPDTGRQASTSFFGWMPVLGLTMQVTLNQVTVTTS